MTDILNKNGRVDDAKGNRQILENFAFDCLQIEGTWNDPRIQGRQKSTVRPDRGGCGHKTWNGEEQRRFGKGKKEKEETQVTIFEAIQDKEAVDGYTHGFYRYPARFSPQFARAVIQYFSTPGDTVLDPFMGSGTTLVEACANGRRAIGTDISSLAVFIARVKTTPLTTADCDCVRNWGDHLEERLYLRNSCKQELKQPISDYGRNISGKSTWPIRKTIELALAEIERLPKGRQRRFARCVLLRTGQWALDCRKDMPTANEVRVKFFEHLAEMISGAQAFADAVRAATGKSSVDHLAARCLHRSAIGIETDPAVNEVAPAALILTSPPYPGVHVLYHRWQVLGRKETPAAFWIAGSQDGHGAAFYTFGDRKQQGLANYYEKIGEAFRSVSAVCGPKTMVVQMLAFSEPMWQLPRYLEVLDRAGLVELKFREWSNGGDGRIWRDVPNRKWYANHRGLTPASKEVVLFHRLQ
jgi:DNA modification methylase